MCKYNNRCARSEIFHVCLEPFKLLVAELTKTAGLKVQYVDQSNEMDAVLIEAVPAGAFAFDALQIPFTVKLSAIIEYIMLSRHVENVLCTAALEHLIERVELLRLRQLRDISRVDKEGRRSRHRVDAIERNLECRCDILIRVLIESNMAVANLQKAKVSSRQWLPSLRNLSKGFRR